MQLIDDAADVREDTNLSTTCVDDSYVEQIAGLMRVQPCPALMPVSPELALVCPELRAVAIAALPDRDPDAWLRPPIRLNMGPVTSIAVDNDAGTPGRSGASFPVALLWYTAGSAAKFALEAALVVAVLVGMLSVIAVLHL
jgi:hypothetical protein